MSTLDDIIKFTETLRDKLEPYWSSDLLYEKYVHILDAPKSAGYCGPSSVILWQELRKNFPSEQFSLAVGKVYKDSTELINGKHVWVVWHHKLKAASVIDITADQSSYFKEKVVVADIDLLAKEAVNYIPYQLARSIDEVDESPKKRAEILRMKTHLPKVRIDYAWLLSDAASVHLNEKLGDGTPLRSYEYYCDIAKKYSEWWEPEGEKILQALCEITGLEFYQNTIDVHVAPWFYAFSSPMALGVVFKEKDVLVNVLTHEIIHRLLTDNKSYDYGHDYVKLWRSMFGDGVTKNTLVHIPVHAVMKKLYVDYLKRPDLVALDKKSVAEYPDYAAAWEYVDEHGHEEIIAKLREDIGSVRS